MSIHLFFCLPRLRSPCTSDFIILLMLVSPDRSTCPPQSGLPYFVCYACHSYLLSNVLIELSSPTTTNGLKFCMPLASAILADTNDSIRVLVTTSCSPIPLRLNLLHWHQ